MGYRARILVGCNGFVIWLKMCSSSLKLPILPTHPRSCTFCPIYSNMSLALRPACFPKLNGNQLKRLTRQIELSVFRNCFSNPSDTIFNIYKWDTFTMWISALFDFYTDIFRISFSCWWARDFIFFRYIHIMIIIVYSFAITCKMFKASTQI